MATCVINPAGDLDLATSDTALREWYSVLRRRSSPARVVLNLTHVEFIDSSGLRALLTLREHVLGYGGTLLVRGASAHQRKLLRFAGLLEFFPDADKPVPVH